MYELYLIINIHIVVKILIQKKTEYSILFVRIKNPRKQDTRKSSPITANEEEKLFYRHRVTKVQALRTRTTIS